MADLDEISRLLGSIEARQAFVIDKLDALSAQVDGGHKEQVQILATVRDLVSRMEELETEVEDDIAPAIKDIQQLKQRGMGILATLGVVSIGAGYVLNKSLKHFLNI